MGGHGATGRKFAGRVLQLITSATGLDDWEWGVTLFARDLKSVRDVVYEMRFDPGQRGLRPVRRILPRAALLPRAVGGDAAARLIAEGTQGTARTAVDYGRRSPCGPLRVAFHFQRPALDNADAHCQ